MNRSEKINTFAVLLLGLIIVLSLISTIMCHSQTNTHFNTAFSNFQQSKFNNSACQTMNFKHDCPYSKNEKLVNVLTYVIVFGSLSIMEYSFITNNHPLSNVAGISFGVGCIVEISRITYHQKKCKHYYP
jgi:hypothetical protein